MRSIAFLTLFSSAICFAQPQANGREMGYAVSEPENGDFDAAYGYALDACMATIHISFRWNALRPDTSSWGPASLNLLDITNIYFPFFNTKMELQIAVTNTVADEVPAELEGLPYDHPLVIAAFKRTLDTVFAHIPNVRLAAMNIGNESDVLWGTNAQKYMQFANFLAAVKPHAQALYQGTQNDTLSVGTTFTWGGITDPGMAPLCQQTNVAGDHVSATYYGIQNGFVVKPPSAVITDIDALVARYPGTKPIRLAEIGYPTSAVCNSNEQLQSDFIESLFIAWDAHLDRIKYMGYFLTTDWSQATVDTLGTYYGITDQAFLEFLRTLGLRTHPGAGTHKLAYSTLLCELQARGFCSTPCTSGVTEQAQLTTLKISPNPASTRIQIQSPALRTGDPVRFMNMQGRVVDMIPYTGEVDVSTLARGPYIVRVNGAAPLMIVLH